MKRLFRLVLFGFIFLPCCDIGAMTFYDQCRHTIELEKARALYVQSYSDYSYRKSLVRKSLKRLEELDKLCGIGKLKGKEKE